MSNLPENWALCKFMDVFDIQGGTQPPKSTFQYEPKPGYIQLLQIRDFGERSVPTYIRYTDALKKCTEQDILIARYGASIGRILTGLSGAYNVAMAKVDIPKEMHKQFVYYLLKSEIFQAPLRLISRSAQSGFSKQDLAEIELPIAPLEEQKRIAETLDELFMRIELCRDRLDRVANILKQIRQAILASAVMGELTEDWREENSNIDSGSGLFIELQEQFRRNFIPKSQQKIKNQQTLPESWLHVPVEAVGEVFLGRQRSPKNHSGSNMRPYVRAANITWNGWDLSDVKEMNFDPRDFERFKLQVGDVLVNEGSGSAEEVGKPAIWRGEIENCCFQNTLICVRPFEEMSDYLYLVFLHAALSKAFVGETRGIGIRHIGKERFAAFLIPLPPIGEQQEIVRRVKTLLALVERTEEHCRSAYAQVEQLIPSLLDKAFRGELVPQDPNDEPATVLLERIQAERKRMESEQKAIRIAQRSTKKEASKARVREELDYSEALRTAFEALEEQADARQLFEQAGFESAEVVQFYEALRAVPEVYNAFKSSLQQRPPRKQSSASRNNFPSENGHFRLVELWLEEFKNLSDYTVRFDPLHSIDIVLGWNGTGKSNLFEALVIIFRDLHRWSEKNQWTQKPMKGYRLRYEINGGTVEVSWKPEEMKRPKLRMETPQEDEKEPVKLETLTRAELPLPRFVFGYYSGPTNRLAEHFLPMKQDHYDRLRTAKSDDPKNLADLIEKRQFFCAENHHAKYVLLAFFHKEDVDINRFLEERLRIVGFESALFIIRKPRWAKKGQTAEDFWGATGIMRRVMERLRQFAIAPMIVEQTVPDGWRSNREDHYYFFLPDLQSLHAFAAEYEDARTFFTALESTDFSELIYDVKIQVRVKATNTEQVAITFHELSEGEQQLLMVLGLMRFTKSHQSLILLDEPDTHLNPHWSVDYLKLLARVMAEGSSEAEEQLTSQILMSTHDPLVIASLFKEQIHLLKRDWQTGACKWDQPDVNPRGLGFTGILTSEMFGMRSDLDEETLADLDNKVRLVAKEGSLTTEEAKELEEINKRLEDAGFQKSFSDPYYSAFIRAWGRRHHELMAGVRFLSPEKKEEIDQIARNILEEVMAELQAEAAN